MIENYYFFDGSSLIAQIRTLQKKDKTLKRRKLDPIKLIEYYQGALRMFGSEEYKRAVFYFPKGETILNEYLVMPNFKKPGIMRDISFKYCGEKLPKSDQFNKFVSDKVPHKWQGRFTKSEKGIDIEICC